MMPRVAVVGYGYWGPNLVRNFHQLGALAAVCDLDAGRLEVAQRLYSGIAMTDDYAAVCADPTIDAIAIATPAHSHYALARQALAAGKHLLVEKPLTTSSADALDLIRMAEAQGRTLMVGHVFEYNPAVRYLRDIIAAGDLGDIYYIYSTRVNLGRIQADLNALWSIAPHDISILLYLFGALPLSVSARGACYLTPGIEDVVFVDLVFANGVIAHVHASWLDPSKVRTVTIVGSKKMVIFDDVDPEARIKVYDKGVLRAGNEIFGEFQLRLHSGDIHIPQLDLREPLRLECAHFLDCVASGRTPDSDGHNGRRVIQVLEAAQRSLATGGAPQAVAP